MDCPICYNLIDNSCIPSCTHHFCFKCIVKWCHHDGKKCPICSTFIREVRLDPEFDMLNNPNVDPTISSEYLKSISIDDFSGRSKELGITLKNNQGPGVKIIKLKKNEACENAGLYVNDIILFMNNVPCIHHQQSIQILEDCYKSETKIILKILLVKKTK